MIINKLHGGEFQSFYANKQQLEEKLKTRPESNNNIRKNNESGTKKAVAAASLAGAVIPVVALNLAKGRGGRLMADIQNSGLSIKNKLKSGFDLIKIENYGEILASTLGGIICGTAAGVATDKNPENREAKYKEGIFEFLNNMTPTTLVATGEYFIGKHEDKLKSTSENIGQKGTMKFARAALVISSVVCGMFMANKSSNKINENYFDKNKKEEEKTKRKFKVQDCFVHLDDLIGLFVLSKSPALKAVNEKIPMDKILPFLYAKSGYEAGSAKNQN